MICEKCEAEMALADELTLNFTNRRLAGTSGFIVPEITRKAQKYVCGECGNIQFIPEQAEKDMEESP